MEIDLTVEDIEAASRRIEGHAVVTPVIENTALNEMAGARLFIKPECLQRSGSFKFRGAYNRLSQLDDDQKKAGVVAWSSGNHAQGVAAAAALLGVPAVIVMPEDAPRVKAEKTRGFGAEIVSYDRYREDREAIGAALAKERGAVIVPSYDDPMIITGQGTCGLEFSRQCEAMGVSLDVVLVCCGGGGLSAGIATAMNARSPDTEVYCVEPAEFDDHKRSLAAGGHVANDPEARSICDALLTPTPGALTFPINKRLLSGGLSVTDDEVRHAIRTAFSVLKLVAEPGGAVALAAALAGKLDIAGKNVGVIISGGNVDPEMFADVIADKSYVDR